MPEESIAQSAIEPRHDSRLLDTRDLSDHKFLDLADLVAPGDLIVVNNTRVRAARLHGKRTGSGGQVEILLLERTDSHTWEALARPSRRLRPGVEIKVGPITAAVLTEPSEGTVMLRFDTADLDEILPGLGETPLPPYFKGHLSGTDRYQTIYADVPGSAAAPTAGLHFTSQVMNRLSDRGVGLVDVDLHVSLDTFRPMAGHDVGDHVMHSEWCSVPQTTADAIKATRDRGGRVVAIGTTVVRTLESRSTGDGLVESGAHRTDLFLQPGAPIDVVDTLVTNFHMPCSTLLVLLAAFMGDGWRLAYETALERRYRFLSFGDAMLAVKTQ